MAPIRRVQLQGPKPAPLAVSRRCTTASGIMKRAVSKSPRRSPVIVYLRSPTVIHVKPRDFMRLVQSLTGNDSSSSTAPSHCSSASGVTMMDEAMSGTAR